jgi:hypothetical protein
VPGLLSGHNPGEYAGRKLCKISKQKPIRTALRPQLLWRWGYPGRDGILGPPFLKPEGGADDRAFLMHIEAERNLAR